MLPHRRDLTRLVKQLLAARTSDEIGRAYRLIDRHRENPLWYWDAGARRVCRCGCQQAVRGHLRRIYATERCRKQVYERHRVRPLRLVKAG